MPRISRTAGTVALSTLISVSGGASALTLANTVGITGASLGGPTSTLGASASTVVNPFDIEVNFTGGLSASQQSVFSSAEAFWETRITGNRYDIALDPLRIEAKGADLGGSGGTLASAGPQTAQITNGAPQDYAYARTGIMRFDTADIGGLESNGTLFDVIVHEMAHVIGFGTLWNPAASNSFFDGTQNVYTTGSGTYTGAYALAAYNDEFGLSESSVPVELDFGDGTKDSHWDEVDFVGSRLNTSYSCDIMTGIFNSSCAGQTEAPFAAATITDTTIASFADIGYRTTVTDAIAPIPLPSAVLMLLGALGALGLTGRRGGARTA